jgi:hypothetical protein
MVEPITVGVGAVIAYLTKDGLAKLLGPTAEYLGDGLREFTKRRAENINRIFQKASEKLGSRIDTPGEVPPRVLKVVLNEGSFCDDELAAEYIGGVLASSRTEQGRDDRGARIAKILDGLSTYQILAHYLVYATVKQTFETAKLSLNMDDRPKMKIFLPLNSFLLSMEFNEGERQQTSQLLTHIFFGLAAEDLASPPVQKTGVTSIVKTYDHDKYMCTLADRLHPMAPTSITNSSKMAGAGGTENTLQGTRYLKD